jgi:predicted acetyltransferase
MHATTGYQIKQLTTAEALAQADDIWTLAFGKTWARGTAHKEFARVFGAYEDNELHAVCAIIDYEMHLNGHWAKCGGVAAVATTPGQRYQNLVTKLLTEAVREMHGRGVAFSSLYPFSYPFYEKMGWAASHWQYRIEVETAWLKRVSKGGNAKKFRMIPLSKVEEMLPAYQRWAESFNLSLNRWTSKFNSMLTWPESRWQIFVHDDGYMLWNMAKTDAERLYVQEFAYTNHQAYLDGLALLAQMDSQFTKVLWHDADSEPFLQLGMPHPKPIIYQEPSMMTRVVNVEAFEKLLPKPIGVKVRDPLGVSGPKDGDIGVGEVLQLVTGFWKAPKQGQPAHLHNIAGGKPLYCVERY